jgi:hypothetical protein
LAIDKKYRRIKKENQMKKHTYFLAFVMALLLNMSFSSVTCFAQNPIKTEKREVQNFHAISFGGSFTVNIKVGDEESLIVEGQSEDINRVETVVEKGVLKIRSKRGVKNWNSVGKKLTINIIAQKLDEFLLSGSGVMKIDGTLNSALADFQVSGSGEIIADLDTENANASVSGSGSIRLSGKTGASMFAISGSGAIKSEGLISDTAEVKISGSGNVYLQTQDELKVTLIGSGSVKYKGNPNITLNKIGSGSVSEIK